MKRLTKTLLLTGILAFASLMTSCQTTTAADASSAVTCEKCKTVWVKRPVQQGGSSGKGSFYTLRNDKTMVCPDCESAVVTFFKTGSLKNNCSHCGGTMTHCTTH